MNDAQKQKLIDLTFQEAHVSAVIHATAQRMQREDESPEAAFAVEGRDLQGPAFMDAYARLCLLWRIATKEAQ